MLHHGFYEILFCAVKDDTSLYSYARASNLKIRRFGY